MKFKGFALLAVLAFFAFDSQAQKIKVTDGDWSVLKGQDGINVEFDYDGMMVGSKDTEEEYVERKMKDAEEKEAGGGEKWHASWLGDRTKRFHPKFEELWNKQMEEHNLQITEDEAKYTLVVKVKRTEPGFNVGVMKKPAECDFELMLKDNETGDIVATATADRAPGSQFGGYDYDAGTRIAESYAICAKKFAAYLAKKEL